MPRRRWLARGRREALTPALRLYLETGDYNAALAAMAADDRGKFELFQLAGRVIRGHVEDLRELWRAHGDTIKAAHPGVTFAERTLRGERGA